MIDYDVMTLKEWKPVIKQCAEYLKDRDCITKETKETNEIFLILMILSVKLIDKIEELEKGKS